MYLSCFLSQSLSQSLEEVSFHERELKPSKQPPSNAPNQPIALRSVSLFEFGASILAVDELDVSLRKI